MKPDKVALAGILAGAGAMYFADPDRGRRRRVLLRDRFVSSWHDLQRQFDKAGRDLRNRSQGLGAEARSMWAANNVDGPVLVERVRSRIGRSVSHPHAIRVRSEPRGRIILEGLALEHEVEYLLKRVHSVPGVDEVVNRLDVRREGTDVPALQGGIPRHERSEMLQQNWTPALRIGAGTLAGAGILYSMTAHDRSVRAAGIAGSLALLARAVANKGLGDIVGMRRGAGGAIHVDKAIHVGAPLEEVFAFWSNFENLPKFMTHLKEVRDLGNGITRWVAAGPGGVSIPWDTITTETRKNESIAWKSVPGSLVSTWGMVRFDSEPEGRTRIGIRMSYCPPAGLLGHGVALLLGADPKSELDDDLARLKSVIEAGKTHAHHAPVLREQLGLGGGRAMAS